MSHAQPRKRPEGLAAYMAVTAAYWAFMLSDGALRMLVLLHFHGQGFTPVQLAYLFLLYELAGIITNLTAGWLAARLGLAFTLYAGLGLQVLALLALAQLSPDWGLWASVAYVMAVQGAAGVAKDLAKTSAKSAVKSLAPAAEGGLFRWVAVLTGSKNAVKGLGFFLGAALLAWAGFGPAVLGMAMVLMVILLAIAVLMPAGLPQGKSSAKFREVLSRDPNLNWLAVARLFLFGARDVWFVVGIPVYFYAVLSDGTAQGNSRAFYLIGGFMAVWTILYGAVQAAAPRLLGAAKAPRAVLVARACSLVGGLVVVPALLAAAVWWAGAPTTWLTGVVAVGLLAFGAIFALNSALHSYLVLAFAQAERVSMDVGFYYMANAAGRLLGTLMSGLCYQLGGVAACLAMAALFLLASWGAAARLQARAATTAD